MSDVARAAGVSVMTVSNVVTGRRPVSAATRARVLTAVAELGYEVNLTARNLRAGRTGTVALIVPRFDHPYFGELGARLARAFEARGRHLVMEQSDASSAGELSALSLARLRLHDGVVLSVVGLAREEVDRIHTSVPVVLLGEQDMPARFDHVMMDNVEGARLATRHLLERGARHVLLAGGDVGPGRRGMSAARADGWVRAHADAGVPADERLVLPFVELEAAVARETVARRARQGPPFDAVFAVTDQVAIGVVAGLRDAGLDVPGDVQVAGFDDLALSPHIGPGLTTVDPSNDWIVDNAVRLLEARMTEREQPPAEHLVSPVRLVVRGSTR